MSCERFYTHSVVSYAAFDELFLLLEACEHYAYIIHDKDATDYHTHLICYFSVPKTISAVRKLVRSDQNTFSQKVRQTDDLLTYLTHENEPDKHQYSRDQICFDNEEYWMKLSSEGLTEKTDNDKFVDDLLADDLDLVFMARKYGRDFMKNHKSYLEFRRLCQLELKTYFKF